MQRRHFLNGAAACALLPLIPNAARAQDRTVRIVVPYAAGGPTDALARLVQPGLQKALGANIIIDNVPGAGGAIGAQAVLRAAADGNTYFLGNNGPSAVTPLLQKSVTFDPLKDFVPVGMMAKATMELVASAQVPATDMKSFIAYAKAHPGSLNYASAGIGSLGHLASELLARQAGIQMTHIAYKGQAPTLQALVANEVQLLLTTPTGAMHGYIDSGRIHLLGVTSDSVSPKYPKADVVNRTLPGFVLYSWFAMMAKAGTPEALLQAMRRALASVLAADDVRKAVDGLGLSVDASGPAQVTTYIQQDVARWGAIIREQNIKAE